MKAVSPPASKRARSARFHHEVDRKGGYVRRDMYVGLDVHRPSSSRTVNTFSRAKAARWNRARWLNISQIWLPSTRSSPSKTALAEDDWDGWKALTDLIGNKVPAGRRRSLRHQLRSSARRYQVGCRQLHPRQGQPDRLAFRDAGRGRNRPQGRLHRRHVASLGRNGRFHHCRSRSRHELRSDLRPVRSPVPTARKVQPADPH